MHTKRNIVKGIENYCGKNKRTTTTTTTQQKCNHKYHCQSENVCCVTFVLLETTDVLAIYLFHYDG